MAGQFLYYAGRPNLISGSDGYNQGRIKVVGGPRLGKIVGPAGIFFSQNITNAVNRGRGDK